MVRDRMIVAVALVLGCGGDRSSAVVTRAIDAAPSVPEVTATAVDGRAARAHVLDAVDSLADAIIAAGGCASRVVGRSFRSAPILCLGVTASSLTSAAIEDPARAAAAISRLQRLIDLALAPDARAAFSPTMAIEIDGHELPRSVLYRGALSLALAGLERLAPDNPRSPMFDAVIATLAADVGRGWIATYGADQIWPCDHAPAAAALRLHAVLRGGAGSASAAAAEQLAARLRAALATATGYPTRVERDGRVIESVPRGTTLAFTAGFLVHGDPVLALAFASELVAARCDRAMLGAAACREWPRGDDRKADAASGPIVNGYSTGATALALAATRALADPTWNADLLATAAGAGADRLDLASRPLEAALVLWGQTARSWLP